MSLNWFGLNVLIIADTAHVHYPHGHFTQISKLSVYSKEIVLINTIYLFKININDSQEFVGLKTKREDSKCLIQNVEEDFQNSCLAHYLS